MAVVVGVVLAVESIPLGILISALLDSSLRRRARFALRLAAFLVVLAAPAVVLIAGAAFGGLGEQATGEVVCVCMLSVFATPVLMPLLLFGGPDRSGPSGDNDDEDHGPGSGPDGPWDPRPISGLPLADADQSPVRARGPLPLSDFRWPRRGSREPDRRPSRVESSALHRRCR